MLKPWLIKASRLETCGLEKQVSGAQLAAEISVSGDKSVTPPQCNIIDGALE